MPASEDSSIDQMSPDEFADHLMAQPAAWTDEDVRLFERRRREFVASDDITLRLGLACMTRSVRDLAGPLETSREAAVAMADYARAARDYADRLKALARLMEGAACRAELALCVRDDMREIVQAVSAGGAIASAIAAPDAA
jgi:hypothetical protein